MAKDLFTKWLDAEFTGHSVHDHETSGDYHDWIYKMQLAFLAGRDAKASPSTITGIRPEILAVAYMAEAHVAGQGRKRTNKNRAEEGRIICELLGAMTGLDEKEQHEKIDDALAQIFHLCAELDIDAERAFRSALWNVEVETDEERDEEIEAGNDV